MENPLLLLPANFQASTVLALEGGPEPPPPLHNLPQDFDKLLPKFDLEEKTVVDDHL